MSAKYKVRRPNDCGVLEFGDGWRGPTFSEPNPVISAGAAAHGVCALGHQRTGGEQQARHRCAVLLQREADHAKRIDNTHLNHVAMPTRECVKPIAPHP